jgi:dienelactone hydrolase
MIVCLLACSIQNPATEIVDATAAADSGSMGELASATAGAAGARATAGTGGQISNANTSSAQNTSGGSSAIASQSSTAAGGNAAGVGGDATPVPGGSGAENPSAGCLAGLKKGCGMREKEACSSVQMVDIGDLIKGAEIPLGPYGAIMEQNLGAGFEIPVASGEANCNSIAASFGEPADVTANVADLQDVDLKLYTVYRPACMREGESYPVITWGNGTCGQTEGYGPLLRYVASYGYVVVAANSRFTGGNGAMTKALDFAASVNADASSVYYKRLDMEKVGAMGHSQGGGATITAARDSRIDSLIIWNGGSDASKPFLAVSGDYDIGNPTAMGLAGAVEGSSQPSAWLFYHKVPQTGAVSGHLTLMNQPERVVEVTVAWWDYQLKGDMTARDFFVGDSCGLCNKDEDFEYGANNLP